MLRITWHPGRSGLIRYAVLLPYQRVPCGPRGTSDLAITGGRVVDSAIGTNSVVNVLKRGDRIVAISEDAVLADRTIDVYADIIIFDTNTIIDRAAYLQADQDSEGVHCVIVNGTVVLDQGKFVDTVAARWPVRGFSRDNS